MSIKEKNIKIAEAIEESVKEHGACVQLFGSWCKGFTEEDRDKVSACLREKGIETIKLYDYAELYVMADMDSAEKEKIIEVYKKSTPGAFEEAAATHYQRKREFEALEPFLNMMANEMADLFMEILGSQDDESDDDDDESEDQSEDQSDDEGDDKE